LEVGTLKVCSFEVSLLTEARTLEVNLLKVGFLEVDLMKLFSLEVGSLEVRSGWPRRDLKTLSR
jgi:hypothetical protein